jgi:hypothetical protein
MKGDDERLERLAERLTNRAYLYDDPVSFRAGVRETVRALNAMLQGVVAERRPDALPPTATPELPAAG